MTWPVACTPLSVRPAQMATHGMAGDEGYRRLDGVLNRGRVLLRLPAGVLGAVILDDGGDAADLRFVLQNPPR